MPEAFWQYEARRPRHKASDRGTVAMVRSIGSSPRDWVVVELGDISRDGLRLLRGPAFPVGQRIEVTIPLASMQLSKCLPATIRWCRETPQGAELACEFDQPMDWAVIGELILNGALDTRS